MRPIEQIRLTLLGKRLYQLTCLPSDIAKLTPLPWRVFSDPAHTYSYSSWQVVNG